MDAGGTDGGSDGGPLPDGGVCKEEGVLCSQHQDCCLGVCSPMLGFCWAGLGGDGGGTCRPDFDPCTQHGDCCNGFCSPLSGLCWAGGSDGGPGCFMDFTPCSQNAQCCGNFCEPRFGLCWSGGGFDGGFDGGSGNPLQCGAEAMACTSGDDCCSATCVDGSCAANPNGGQVACGAITDLCRPSDTGTDPASPDSCDPCVEAICLGDPWCCQNDWDGACVQAAAQGCGRCPNAPPFP